MLSAGTHLKMLAALQRLLHLVLALLALHAQRHLLRRLCLLLEDGLRLATVALRDEESCGKGGRGGGSGETCAWQRSTTEPAPCGRRSLTPEENGMCKQTQACKKKKKKKKTREELAEAGAARARSRGGPPPWLPPLPPF